MQSLEVVGDDSEGPREDRINGAGPGIDVKCSGAVDVTICKQELVVDRGDAEGPDGVPPSVGTTDHGDEGET